MLTKKLFHLASRSLFTHKPYNNFDYNGLLGSKTFRPFVYTPRYTFSKQDKNNNQQSPNNNDWRQKIRQFVKKINDTCSSIYNKRFQPVHIAVVCILSSLLYISLLDTQSQQITIDQFLSLLETGRFKEITFVQEQYFHSQNVQAHKVEAKINGQLFYCFVPNFDLIMSKVINDPEIKFANVRRSGLESLMYQGYVYLDIISILVIIAHIKSVQGKSGGQMGGLGGMPTKSKKFQMIKNVNVKFNDVAGLHQVKREVQEVVDFLKFPEKYTSLGATIPRGVLLTGPPGTGKTLLAKACAGQAGVPFYSVSGSDFVEMFVGVGASRVRQLFKQAKSNESAAIVFIDELDAIGKKRMNKLGGNDQRQGTLNQLLVQMDGFQTNNKVVVMGATNRKQILDNALVRPGRFDRQVQVGLPDLKGRFQIFKVHLRPLNLSSKYNTDEYAKRLASLTPGFSGAQIANLCNQAAILSARHDKQVVQMIDFEISSERVIGGVERKGFVSLQEKKTVSYHQCGHAVVSWFLEGADPLLKVTIIPRSKGALGFAQYFVNQNQLQTKQQLFDRICFILGGRCAQLHFFNEVTTGAYDDLSKAYDLAYTLIAKYGMGQDIGYIGYPDIQYTKPYGENTQSQIDSQIQKIIKLCTQRTKKMIIQHEHHIKNLAEQLLIKQTLDVRAIQNILGKRPFPPNKTFEAYLQTSQATP